MYHFIYFKFLPILHIIAKLLLFHHNPPKQNESHQSLKDMLQNQHGLDKIIYFLK